MKESTKIKLAKVIKVLLVLLCTLLIFQVTLAPNFSFSNNIVDNLFYSTSSYVGLSILLLLFILLILRSNRKWIRILSIIAIVPVGLFFLISLLFMLPILLADYPRYYFFEKDGFHYYVVSERLFAFEGSRELKYYKEKTLWLFLKERKIVDEHELTTNGIDPYKQSSKLMEIYNR
jgi:hypothetical protein